MATGKLPEKTESIHNAAGRSNAPTAGGIGVIPIQGPIDHRASFLSDYFGWPTTERIGQQFEQFVNDPAVSAIVLDINSPGGNAVGNEELHQTILRNRGKKPVIAVANGMAASAAYYIASAADQIVVTPSGEVGSIGTVMLHGDLSKMYEDAGVKVTVIKAGPYKWEGHPYAPLTDEARAQMQKEVDAHYNLFINAVAKGRGVTASTVKKDFGQGRMVMAKDAVAAGMADRVGTLDEVIGKLAGRKPAAGAMRNEEPEAIQETDPAPEAAPEAASEPAPEAASEPAPEAVAEPARPDQSEINKRKMKHWLLSQ